MHDACFIKYGDPDSDHLTGFLTLFVIYYRGWHGNTTACFLAWIWWIHASARLLPHFLLPVSGTFSSRRGHGAWRRNSCVHTNRMNWTVRWSVLGSVPWPPSVKTTLPWKLSIWIILTILHLIWFDLETWKMKCFQTHYIHIQHRYVPPPNKFIL